MSEMTKELAVRVMHTPQMPAVACQLATEVLTSTDDQRIKDLEAKVNQLTAHSGDPCVYCNTPHDDVGIGPCRGTRKVLRALIVRLDDALEDLQRRNEDRGIF